MSDFTVLLSVYHKEKPEYLRQSLDSVFSQTLPPTEVVLVQDGPITQELTAVVEDFLGKHPEMKTVKLAKGQGLGGALNEGLKHCSFELVARMDTDDICKPQRFQTQIAWMEAHPETDVCGCWIDEFLGDTSNIVSSRKPPVEHEAIVSFGRKRNPVNHPTVVFRKQAVEKAGGYQPFYLFEDYYLWIRMIQAGCKFHNIEQSLLFFRMSENMFHRRGGKAYSRSEIRLQREFHKMGYISWPTMAHNIVCRSTVRNLPNGLRKLVYLFLLRK
jgi:glycosyltransferase involved in cell wall biosynthesis